MEPEPVDGPHDRSTAAKVTRWFLGPWPYFPWVIFPLITSYLILQNFQLAVLAPEPVCRLTCVRVPSSFLPALTQQYGGDLQARVDVALIVLNAVLAGAVMALMAWGFQRWFCDSKQASPRRAPYLLGLVAIAVAGTTVRLFLFNPLLDDAPTVSALIPNAIRMFGLLTLMQGVSGQATERYRQAAAAAGQAREEADRQRLLMLTADEEARRDVAAFLHDRVQAALLVVGVELERYRLSHGDTGGDIGKAIDEIERIRGTDVRAASRRLSPDFEAVGLDSPLDELARSWTGVLAVNYSYLPAGRPPEDWRRLPTEVMIATYRIIEQGLLNAVAHGRALRVAVRIGHQGDRLTVMIEDDGSGMPGPRPLVGRGGSIIDAWVSALGGDWSWGSRSPRQGAWLHATLPFTTESSPLAAPDLR